jgi:hypothetical protein
MLVAEASACPESLKPAFMSGVVETITGLPPPRLKRPPRA